MEKEAKKIFKLIESVSYEQQGLTISQVIQLLKAKSLGKNKSDLTDIVKQQKLFGAMRNVSDNVITRIILKLFSLEILKENMVVLKFGGGLNVNPRIVLGNKESQFRKLKK